MTKRKIKVNVPDWVYHEALTVAAKGMLYNKIMLETECLRIARNMVKEELERQGVKVAWVESKQITKAAKAFLELEGRKILRMAKRNLKGKLIRKKVRRSK